MSLPASQALSGARDVRVNPDGVLEAFDALRVAVTVFDAADRLVYCNRHFHHLFRAVPAREALIGLAYSELVRLEVESGEIAESKTLEGLDGFVARRYAQLHDGDYWPLDIRLADGRIVEIKARRAPNGGFVMLWSDVTSVRQLVDAANQQVAFLADLIRRPAATGSAAESANLLRTMSHELKSPLNAIIGFSDLMRTSPDRYGPEQMAEYAGLIHAGGHNLLRLINQILDLTRIAAGHFVLSPCGSDAGAVLLAARDAVEDAAAAKSITLAMDDTGGRMMVQADEAVLRSMVGHLVENAVTFTHPGGEVQLSLARAGDRIRVTISDNGPGVETHDLPRILLPFEQAGARNHGHGAGLGLTLVKALVDLHGGELAIESTLGEGFTATLDLPAA